MKVEKKKEIENKQFDELREIGRLANEFLEKYCHPHSVIEINEDGIKLNENIIFIPRDEIEPDDMKIRRRKYEI